MASSFASYIFYCLVPLLMMADNFNSCAVNNPEQIIQNKIKLSEEVEETSGLAHLNNSLITHNDAGNKNILYTIDIATGKIKNKYTVAESINIDWEDLAQSANHIFIADIGNNDGDRNDLKIYRIRLADLKHNQDITLKPDGIIEFRYPDQSNFKSRKKHKFDSEALIYLKENLYLFSKNSEGSLCNIYKIPSKPGSYVASKVDSFNIKGLVTGAAISPSNNKIILTVYNKDGDSFLYSLEGFQDYKFFSGKNNLITLGSYKEVGQIEGVVFEDEESIFITSEKTKSQKPKLYKIKL